jgi:Tol biopolymer transport system component
LYFKSSDLESNQHFLEAGMISKISLAVLIIFSMLTAQEKRAITFEDFFAMKRVDNIALSPDGKKAAFDVKVPRIETNDFKTDIWLLNLENNIVSQFTNDEESSSAPAWHPDGKAVYFTRGEQIWKKSAAGGNAVKVTDMVLGAGGAVISRDGKKMLFVSESYPDCETEDCNRNKMEAAENCLVKARVIDHLMYRHWNSWKEGRFSHVFMADADGKNIVDLTPGAYDTPPVSLGSSHDYTFSPDSRFVCYVQNRDKIVAASTNNDLFIK